MLQSPTAGQQHYENLCMKAVNQSIGRAVRHRNDYAAVLLIDQRYTRTHVQAALPAWIRTSLSTHTKFGLAFAQLNRVSSFLYSQWLEKVKRLVLFCC
jgi:chromosome transmission fidelity protein 1